MHPGLNADFLKRGLHGQGVHDRGQHAHIVGSGPFHVARSLAQPPEDVAAADDEADLHTFAGHVGYGLGHRGHGLLVDSIALVPHQDLSRDLQQDALVEKFERSVGHGGTLGRGFGFL